MSTLYEKANAIKNEKDLKVIPQNIKNGINAFGVIGTYTGENPVQEKDVNFIDYDGTVLYSYTASEFAELTELPANPTHTGLTSQGWNWLLSDAKTYVAEYGKLWIGQMYVTDDNKTRVYVNINENTLSPYVGFKIDEETDSDVIINWGDGTSDTVTGNAEDGYIFTGHTYTNPGNYMITLSNDSQIVLGGGTPRGTAWIFSASSSTSRHLP